MSPFKVLSKRIVSLCSFPYPSKNAVVFELSSLMNFSAAFAFFFFSTYAFVCFSPLPSCSVQAERRARMKIMSMMYDFDICSIGFSLCFIVQFPVVGIV